ERVSKTDQNRCAKTAYKFLSKLELDYARKGDGVWLNCKVTRWQRIEYINPITWANFADIRIRVERRCRHRKHSDR
ncbi:MAG: hypothetical protein O3C60_16515, partial [Planctomycetota bacterium]|nr:hypothetical protein [Planctomycetota bacterium]